MSSPRAESRVAALRQAFDRSFAQAPGKASRPLDAAVAIQIGTDLYAVRLQQIAAMQVDRRVTPIPSSSPSLLGICAVRGVLAPVYDLRALLGYPAGPALRWLIFANAGQGLVGLAFDRFDSHLKLEKEGEGQAAPLRSEHARPHIRGLALTLKGSLPMLDLSSILAALSRP